MCLWSDLRHWCHSCWRASESRADLHPRLNKSSSTSSRPRLSLLLLQLLLAHPCTRKPQARAGAQVVGPVLVVVVVGRVGSGTLPLPRWPDTTVCAAPGKAALSSSSLLRCACARLVRVCAQNSVSSAVFSRCLQTLCRASEGAALGEPMIILPFDDASLLAADQCVVDRGNIWSPRLKRLDCN